MVFTNLVIAAWMRDPGLLDCMVRCLPETEPSGKGTEEGGDCGFVSVGHRAGVRRFHAGLDLAQASRISEVHDVTGRLDDYRPDFRFPCLVIGT